MSETTVFAVYLPKIQWYTIQEMTIYFIYKTNKYFQNKKQDFFKN